MKVPIRWLEEFVQTGLSPAELAHRLTMAGLEAEKITTVKDAIKYIEDHLPKS